MAHKPTFKTKKCQKQSFRIYRKSDSSIRVYDHKIKLFKEEISIAEMPRFDGTLKTATISRSNTGKWFISFSIELNQPIKTIHLSNNEVGIDWGLETFLTLSDGTKIQFPEKRYNELMDKIKFYQKKKQGTTMGSKRNERAKAKLSQAWENLSNFKTDFIQKTASMIGQKYSYVAIEDLSPNEMAKSHRVAGKIMRNCSERFYTILKSKTAVHKIGRYFPSSQTCSSCGQIHKEMKNLSNRTLICHCGLVIDRDINAAKNILVASKINK